MKRSTYMPLILMAYIGVMAFVGRENLVQGDHLHYFGVLVASLAAAVALHFVLKRKERLEAERRKDQSDAGNSGSADSAPHNSGFK